MAEISDKPNSVVEALWATADWLDHTDELMDLEGEDDGEVQRDLRKLAEWFEKNPHIAATAWDYVIGL
jgi:hypothetical protein